MRISGEDEMMKEKALEKQNRKILTWGRRELCRNGLEYRICLTCVCWVSQGQDRIDSGYHLTSLLTEAAVSEAALHSTAKHRSLGCDCRGVRMNENFWKENHN